MSRATTGCSRNRWLTMRPRVRRTGLILIFLWFFIGGIAHFALTSAEMQIVPPWMPWPRATVLISGCFELLGAFGLLLPKTRSLAGYGLAALTVAVTPAHIYMLQRHDLFQVPYWILVARLPLQLLLLLLIVWTTRPEPSLRPFDAGQHGNI